MTVRDTTIAMPRHRQQVRGFAVIWTGITLLVGVCTFLAIYAATGIAANGINGSRSNPPPPVIAAAAQIDATQAVTESVTSAPTLPPIASDTPLAKAVALQITSTPVTANNAAALPPATAAPTQAVGSAPQSVATQSAAVMPTLQPINDKAFNLGIQVQENPDPKTYELWMKMVAEQLKLSWLKSQVRWADLEKTEGTIDFGTLDVILPLASQYNVKVLLSIVTAPRWAREKGASTNPDHNGPPADPQKYVNFVTAIVKRYPGKIHAIEVWNEQNLDREWDLPKGLQAANYVALMSATYKAVKAIDPNIVMISGALSPVSVSDPPRFYDDFVYMDALIKAGLLNTVDCVGAHHNGINLPPTVNYQDAPRDPKGQRSKFRGPYDNPHHEWSFKSTLEGYHARIAAAGGTQKLCITEFGWPSMGGITLADKKTQAKPPVGFEFAADNTLADQADYTDAAIKEMVNWGWVQLAFVWNLNYGAQIGWDPKNDNVPYSILGPNFQQRPVWLKIAAYDFRDQPRSATTP